jgi:hypothetical protein
MLTQLCAYLSQRNIDESKAKFAKLVPVPESQKGRPLVAGRSDCLIYILPHALRPPLSCVFFCRLGVTAFRRIVGSRAQRGQL